MASASNQEFLGPLLKAMKAIGGAASVSEQEAQVAKMCDLSKEEFEAQEGKGTRTKLGYKLAWARTYLKRLGFIESSARAVWVLTPAGRKAVNLSSYEIKRLVSELTKKEKLRASKAEVS